MASKKTNVISVRITEDLYEALERVCEEEGRPVADTVRLSIFRYLESRNAVAEMVM